LDHLPKFQGENSEKYLQPPPTLARFPLKIRRGEKKSRNLFSSLTLLTPGAEKNLTRKTIAIWVSGSPPDQGRSFVMKRSLEIQQLSLGIIFFVMIFYGNPGTILRGMVWE